jgi:hypothetical protein
MPTIRVELPDDRYQAGNLVVQDDHGVTIAGPFTVLGRADGEVADDKNNQYRDRMLPFGDTPLGTYEVTGFAAAANANEAHRLGPNNRIRLNPVGGEAAAAKFKGRTGLEIHGGYMRGGKLRPTNGCLRLSDADMASLIAAITAMGNPPDRCEFVPGAVTVVVSADDDDDTNYEGDPLVDLLPLTSKPTASFAGSAGFNPVAPSAPAPSGPPANSPAPPANVAPPAVPPPPVPPRVDPEPRHSDGPPPHAEREAPPERPAPEHPAPERDAPDRGGDDEGGGRTLG